MISDLLVLILAIAAAVLMLAPLESLHWWATRGSAETNVTQAVEGGGPLALAAAPSPSASAPLNSAAPANGPTEPGRYLYFLSGIAAIAGGNFPDEEKPLISDLRERLPSWQVLDDVFPYAVDNEGLTADNRPLAGLWRKLEAMRIKDLKAVPAWLINIRNATQMVVSADRRYGPTYNLGTAQELYRSMLRHGHKPGDPADVVLLGWSGGGQIALGAVWYLEAMGLRVSQISIGGWLSDDISLERIHHLWHLYGTKDVLQASGALLFAGRWPIAFASPWNKAMRAGKITMVQLGPYHHNDLHHYFDRESILEGDGRTYAGKVIGTIVDIVDGLPAGSATA